MTFESYWENKGARVHVKTHEERARLAWDAARDSMITRRELGTILAALRCWQEHLRQEGVEPSAELMMIATNCSSFKALTPLEIDRLCEKLNQ